MPFIPAFSGSMRCLRATTPQCRADGNTSARRSATARRRSRSSGSNGSFAFYNPNLIVHRRRTGWVRSQRDFASLRGWRPGTDARLRSPAPFVAAGVVGALPPDGLKAVMPGICDGWDPIGDEFLRR